MTIFCISCPKELPEEHEAAKKHFEERGIQVEWIEGIHAETFGILAWRPYRRDNPKAGFLIKMAAVGLALTHHMIWQLCVFAGDDSYLILEADAEFGENWKEKFEQAMKDVPDDWQIILFGNSNTFDKPKTHIKGEIWEVKYPFCSHAYLVRPSALLTLLSIRDAATNNDIACIEKAYPKLRVYTVLPALVKQRGRALEE